MLGLRQPTTCDERREWWCRQLSRQQSANPSVTEFCRQLGVSITTLYYWKKRVHEARRTPSGGFLAMLLAPHDHDRRRHGRESHRACAARGGGDGSTCGYGGGLPVPFCSDASGSPMTRSQMLVLQPLGSPAGSEQPLGLACFQKSFQNTILNQMFNVRNARSM